MNDKIFDYHKICNDVKKLDKKIQFVSVINADGNLITGGMNGESNSNQNERFYEELYEEVAVRIKLRKKFDGVLGEVKGTMVIRNRVITMNFPLKENILFVSADTSINYSEIMEKILKEILDKVSWLKRNYLLELKSEHVEMYLKAVWHLKESEEDIRINNITKILQK